MSVDPFIHGSGNSQGINPYSYIMNNPLSGTDPTGYAPEDLTDLDMSTVENIQVTEQGDLVVNTSDGSFKVESVNGANVSGSYGGLHDLGIAMMDAGGQTEIAANGDNFTIMGNFDSSIDGGAYDVREEEWGQLEDESLAEQDVMYAQHNPKPNALDGVLNGTLPIELWNENRAEQCRARCLRYNYGELYEWADALSPLSIAGVSSSYFASEVETYSKERADINLYKDSRRDYETARRQVKRASQFARFNAVSGLASGFALGFQVGALGVCRVECWEESEGK